MKPSDVGKQDDIRITTSEFGAFVPRVWGKARVPGNIVFTTGITHTIINTPTGGGKGVPQAPATRQHVYTTTVGVLACRGPISRFRRTWADIDLILNDSSQYQDYFEAENATLAGGASVSSDPTASGGEYVTNLGSGGKVTFNFSSIPNPPYPNIDDPDEIAEPWTRIEIFYKCAATRTGVLTADAGSPESVTFAATGTDWTPQVWIFNSFVTSLEIANALAAAPDIDYVGAQKYYTLINTNPQQVRAPAYAITGNVNQNIIYPLDVNDPSAYYNAPLTADANGKAIVNESIPAAATRYYLGTTAQLQDSALTAFLDIKYGTGEGILRAPAHRGLAYVVFENRQLKQGRVENFTFEIEAGGANVNSVLEDLLDDVTLGAYANLTATAGLEFVGFVEHQKMSRRQLINALEQFFFFRIAEIDGQIKTVLDTTVSSATISSNLLRAHNEGEELPRHDAEVLIKEENLFPSETRVSILNPDLEYRNETVASVSLFGSPSATEAKEFNFPLIVKGSTARNVAERLLLKEWSENKAFEFYGMPEMAKYSVGDVITVPVEGIDFRMRIERKQMALPIGKIRFQCVAVNAFAPSVIQDEFTTVQPESLALKPTYAFPRNSIAIPIQSLPVTTADKGKLGVYLAMCGRGRGAGETISLYREFDTDNYVLQGVFDAPALAGLCDNSESIWTGATVGVEDTTTTLDIWFFDDVELESVTAPDLAAFPTLNLIRVGAEWMQFKTAAALTLEANSPYRSKWRLTNFQRGLFGTSAAIGTHAADEYAVVYTSAVKFYELDRSDVGTTVTFKTVTNGQSEENGQVTSFTFSPVSAYTVTNAVADRAYDANATSVNELADVVATMIEDLNL